MLSLTHCYLIKDTVRSSSKPGYLIVAISAAAVVVVVVTMVVGIVCFLRVRRKHRLKGQESSQVEMKTKEEFT